MPSPLGHALGGVLAGLLAGPSTAPAVPPSNRLLVWCAVAACLPDLDFLWGRHNMETHSVGFALLLGVGAALWTRSGRLGLAVTLAVATHVLFDWLGSVDSPPIGVMAWWPFDDGFYFADAWLFDAISRRHWLPGFVRHNVLAVLKEFVLLAPFTFGLWWLRRRRIE